MNSIKLDKLKNLDDDGKKIVAISGKAGAGKDTIGLRLTEYYGYEKFSFAYPIYQIAKIAFNLTDEQMADRDFKPKALEHYPDFTFREVLQIIGTEMFRDIIDREIWCKNLGERIEKCENNLIFISDLRFPNEKEYMQKHYGDRCLFLKVIRKGQDGNVGVSNHESEAYEIECDLDITNNGSIEELHDKVDNIINTIRFHV